MDDGRTIDDGRWSQPWRRQPDFLLAVAPRQIPNPGKPLGFGNRMAEPGLVGFESRSPSGGQAGSWNRRRTGGSNWLRDLNDPDSVQYLESPPRPSSCLAGA
jgi:hypothetical protein